MIQNEEDEQQRLLLLASLMIDADSKLFAAVVKRRKVIFREPPLKIKVGRRIFERPVYTCSAWWIMLHKGDCKIEGHPQSRVFRRRFGVPFSMFKSIVADAREWTLFGNKRLGKISSDCTGVEGVPLELKILGALRMSAKGCSFDAIAELSGMSISTMQLFYHAFWEKFVCIYRDSWIFYPSTAVDAAENLSVYARLGFPGAIGSVDCTHVRWLRCPALFQNTYSGKEKKATVAYEVTVNHSGRCLNVSVGHPGSRNDKTIVKTDKLVMDLRDRKILQDVEFKLFKVSLLSSLLLPYHYTPPPSVTDTFSVVSLLL